ncbi:hypothetical protein [Aidingimonas halophila]|uniref:DUF4375 domain-containing protein n=1 Tax=Aidingimonas halophila TaxID=574349 RepID=A0A1H2SVA7_9GAMM|nr:hypothetical protein [Aidingimonas halophila]GHC17058.1 hypothetical protein GCM10008094_03060 [Aidingimonas halophila]SDW35606.1 hypothetical protein SAMN05443545_101668 [Aidingimonas halophila]
MPDFIDRMKKLFSGGSAKRSEEDTAGIAGNKPLSMDEAYGKTLDDFRELEIIKTLGWMHSECLAGRASDSEIRDFVLGIYRTRYMTAGYGKQLFLSQGGELDEAIELSDELSDCSPIAQMSLDAIFQFSNISGDPFDVIKPEAEELLKAGGMMVNLMITGKPEIAKIVWRDGAKGVFHSP